MSYVYLFTQAASTGRPPPAAGALAAMGLTYLQQAVHTAPTWRNYSFLGAAYLGQGIGGMDDAMRAMGRTMLEQQLAEGKVFTLLARGDAGHAAPPGDPDFELAIESYFNYFEQCLGRQLDRSHPDLGGLDDITPATEPPMSSCWNDPHAPHVETASLLNFGDSLVKAGNLTAAQAAYRAATTRADFATWKFANVVQSRMTEDLAARAALYRASDPSQWPPIGVPGHPCTHCHGT